MNGIILCRDHISGVKAITKHTAPVLLELCGKTVLERLTDKLIAAGIEQAYVLSEKYESGIKRAVERYRHKDKIKLEYLNGKDSFILDADSDYLVCDAFDCIDTDITGFVKNDNYDCQNDTPALAFLRKSDVKRKDFTDANDVFVHLLNKISEKQDVSKTVGRIGGIEDFLRRQAEILDKSGGIIKLTDSNFNGVTFIPPVYIGRNVTIGAGAVIGPHTAVSDNARIGDGTAVYGSYIGKNAVVCKNCFVEGAYLCPDSALMSRVRLSPSAVVTDGISVRSYTFIGENAVVDADHPDATARCKKFLHFDDDGICSLFDGTADVSEFVRLGKAVGSSLGIGDSAVVGRSSDNRMQPLLDAVCCGLFSAGVNVYDIGECIMLQLSYAVTRTESVVGIFVGVDANGDIRLVQKSGLPLLTKLEQDICECFERKSFRFAALSQFGKHIDATGEKAAYLRFLKSELPKSLKGLCVSMRTNEPVAAQLCDELFHYSNDCRGERVVFQLSSDLMSVNAYSETVGNVRWENLCLLGCRIMFDENKPVSLPHCMPFAAERLAKRCQGTLLRYNTVCVDENDAAAREIACKPKGAFVRDALMLCVMICRYLDEKHISFKQALDEIEPVCCTQRFISADAKAVSALENAMAVGSEGFEVKDENTSAYIRPCKNSRDIMIFAESTKMEFASSFCDDITQKLRKYAENHHDSSD